GLVRTDARQDGDGTHPLSSGGQAPPSGQQRRSRAPPGNNGWTSPLQDTTRVSHSKGHARCHRSRPGSSPNHRAVSQSFQIVTSWTASLSKHRSVRSVSNQSSRMETFIRPTSSARLPTVVMGRGVTRAQTTSRPSACSPPNLQSPIATRVRLQLREQFPDRLSELITWPFGGGGLALPRSRLAAEPAAS